MDTPKPKSELIRAMEAGRSEWDRVLSQIDEQYLSEPSVEGVWSVKQIVAHVAGYEEWTAAFLNDRLNPGAGNLAAHDAFWQQQLDVYRQDHPDFPARMNETDDDQTNAVVVAAYDQYTAREVLERERQAYQGLLSAVRVTSESQLIESGTFGRKSIMEILPNQCYGHYQMHLPAIQRWLAQQQIK
jgi:Protein of unknown function (DUF1706)